jgi:acetyltransferase-like isoleucine patch superfamily enzyme
MLQLFLNVKRFIRKWLTLVLVVVPSPIKIPIYRRLFGYQIGKNVRIGLSWINVAALQIGDYVRIGHFNRFKNIPEVQIGDYCSIGFGNTFTSTYEFIAEAGIKARGNRPRLNLGNHCQITMLHYFDVQDSFRIGAYTVIAGRESVFFTHYLDVVHSTQSAKPISIGDYCMVGTNTRFVPGASIADCCVVAMAAVVTKPFTESFSLIAGNPALVIKKLPEDAAYFKRKVGWIGEFSSPPSGLSLD